MRRWLLGLVVVIALLGAWLAWQQLWVGRCGFLVPTPSVSEELVKAYLPLGLLERYGQARAVPSTDGALKVLKDMAICEACGWVCASPTQGF